MNKTKKHILTAAKDSIAEGFNARIESLYASIEKLLDSKENCEGLCLCLEEEANCSVCKEVAALRGRIIDIQEEWEEWSLRAKKNKKKIGKRVEWTNQREQAPMRTINTDALNDYRRSRKESRRTQVGIEWLYEGALVTRKGQNDMMIVTRVTNESVEVLHQGTTRWFRSLQLRPSGWMSED